MKKSAADYRTQEMKNAASLARAAAKIPIWSGKEYPRYDPGEYDVRCNEVQGPAWIKQYQRWSIRLECHFLTEDGLVSGFLNLGNNPRQPHPGKRSYYARLWIQANQDLPNAGEMPPEIFIGKFFRVRIEDATRDSKGKLLPPALVYSKIVEFIDCTGP